MGARRIYCRGAYTEVYTVQAVERHYLFKVSSVFACGINYAVLHLLFTYWKLSTITGAHPVCGTNASESNGGIMEGDYIQMWCTVNYSGNWIAVIDWTKNDRQMTDTDSIYTNTSTTVTSLLTTQLSSSDNIVTFTCKTTFNETLPKFKTTLKPDDVVATNVPGYQFSCNATTNVLCK